MNRQDTASERGASLVSYALLIGALAMVAVASLSQVGGSVDERFTETGEAFQAVDAGSPTVDFEDEDEEEEEPVAPDDGGATGGGGESGDGGSGGDGEGTGPTEDDGTAPDEDEEADQPDDEGSDTDPLDEAGGSGGTPGDSTDPEPDPDPDPVDDGNDDGGDGAGSGGDTSDEDSETVGVFGEFSVVFKVVDGKVVIGSIASPEWDYKVQVDNGSSVRIRFSNGEKGKANKTVVVEAWLNKDGKLETSVT